MSNGSMSTLNASDHMPMLDSTDEPHAGHPLLHVLAVKHYG